MIKQTHAFECRLMLHGALLSPLFHTQQLSGGETDRGELMAAILIALKTPA